MAANGREFVRGVRERKPSSRPHSRPFASIRGWPPHQLVIVGVGNIGSQFVDHAARLSGLECVLVVDRDRYEPANLASQAITGGDVGRPKAEVQARRLRRLNPQLRVEAFAADLETLPLGWLRGAVVVGCLDSVHARLRLGEMAWRVGAPFLDGGVNPEAGLARVTCYLPGLGQPCCACGLTDEDYEALGGVHPCAGVAQALPINRARKAGVNPRTPDASRLRKRVRSARSVWSASGLPALSGSWPTCIPPSPSAPPTGGTFSLGGLAAAWLALECERLLRDGPHASLAGREVLLETRAGRLLVSRRNPNPACRFDHRSWPIEPLSGVTLASSLAEAIESASHIMRSTAGVVLSLPGQRLATALHCPGCGAMVERLHVVGRGGPHPCPQCRKRTLAVVGFKLVDRVDRHLPRALLRQSLRRVGFRAGDVLAVECGREIRYLEIPRDGV